MDLYPLDLVTLLDPCLNLLLTWKDNHLSALLTISITKYSLSPSDLLPQVHTYHFIEFSIEFFNLMSINLTSLLQMSQLLFAENCCCCRRCSSRRCMMMCVQLFQDIVQYSLQFLFSYLSRRHNLLSSSSRSRRHLPKSNTWKKSGWSPHNNGNNQRLFFQFTHRRLLTMKDRPQPSTKTISIWPLELYSSGHLISLRKWYLNHKGMNPMSLTKLLISSPTTTTPGFNIRLDRPFCASRPDVSCGHVQEKKDFHRSSMDFARRRFQSDCLCN